MARRIADLSHAASQARAQPPTVQNPTRSIFKAKTSPAAPLTSDGGTSARRPVPTSGTPVTTEVVAARQPPTQQTPAAASGGIQIPAGNGGIALQRPPDKDKPDQLAITWQTARTIALNCEGGGVTMSAPSVTTDLTANGGAVTITPSLQFQEQRAHATSHGSVTMSHARHPLTRRPLQPGTVRVSG